MKTKKFTITIPEPCTENWNEMTPTARGKFCAHCQKDVIDFSDKTDSEIANFVKNNKGNFCGRFVETQLDKEFSYIEPEKKSTLKYAAALALGLLTAENSLAQDENKKPNAIQVDNKLPEINNVAKNDSTIKKTACIQISGFILDKETNTPIPYAAIYDPITNRGTISRTDGFFTFPAEVPSKLTIKSLGYKSSYIEINDLTKLNSSFKIELLRNPEEMKMLMGVTITPMPKEKLMFTEPIKVKKK
ncbi:MAG TPA: carboxypeptidase-like regulatory domain-containing protein [Chitinophagales bacterium]|nr:carboxypeptidase-like regulatory domain-containing protein [Chitinophagales bacterium]